MFRIRTILKAGSTVFGLSAFLLIAAPGVFLDLLNLDSLSEPLQWSMRMIGITLIALAGNMWINSTNPSDESVRRVGILMAFAATSLGILTLLIPEELTWFTYLYAAVGFGFGLSYLVALLNRNY
jgi:hypothetical protein